MRPTGRAGRWIAGQRVGRRRDEERHRRAHERGVHALAVARALARHERADIATLSAPIESLASLLDPNVVKVVSDPTGRVLYFSRAPIPWDRDGAPSGLASQRSFAGARRHIGLYAYRVAALKRLAALAPSPLEQREKLEQLRALENGLPIVVADAAEPPGPDVNTAQDLELVRALLEEERLR